MALKKSQTAARSGPRTPWGVRRTPPVPGVTWFNDDRLGASAEFTAEGTVMYDPKDPLARFVSGLVLPAVLDSGMEVDTETAGDGYSIIVRLPKSDGDLYHLVSSVLKPSVWWRAERTSRPKPRSARTRVGWLPRWSGLDGIAEDDVPRMLEAWRRATSRRGVPDFIRVSVNPYERSDLLRVAARAGQPVVATVRWLSGVAFTWHYPIRVAVAGGSGSRLLAELRDLPGAGRDFVVSQEHPDVCFVRGLDDGPLPDCGTVLAVGPGEADRLFSWAIWNRHSPNGVAVAAGVPRNDLSWWPGTIHALEQNMPLDCALTSVVPEACVGGISAALTATTLGYEAASWRGSAIDTKFVGPGTLPDREGDGPELGQSIPASARRVNVEGVEAPGVTNQEDRRRLVLEFRDGAKKVRTVLPPNRELTLQIAVGLPKRGQPAGCEPVIVPHPEEPAVTLDVVAHCSSWSEPQRSQVALLVHNYDQPSTSAVLTFVTPDPGAMVITIDLLYRGRVIQQADVLAAVRDRALPGERIRIEVRHTSATTMSIAEPAELCLDATGSELRDILTGSAVPLAPLSDVLDAFEVQVSRVLGVDEAPETLADNRARELLIALARRGAGLRDQLAGLGLNRSNGATVSVVVQEQTRVLPLELLYEGETPGLKARWADPVL